MRDRIVEPAESWVVTFRASGARPPLFCACAGGGDALDYRDLAYALPDDQPVYAFGLPAPGEDEPFPTVQQLAATYVRKVRELQERGPYQLCGHSFGGLVVYEMAALLAKEGEDVRLLALLDTLYPRYSQNLSPREQREFRLTYLSDRFAKYGRNLLRGRPDRILLDAAAFFYGRGKKLFWRGSQWASSRLGLRIAPLLRSDAMVLSAAWRMYVPSPYQGRLVLFNASERTSEYGTDRTLGWKTCATGVIDIHVVRGDHYTILHPPHLGMLIDRLTPYLVGAVGRATGS